MPGEHDVVWCAFPSCNFERAKRTVDKWRDMGYRTAVYLDHTMASVNAEFEHFGRYSGYWDACNTLAVRCMSRSAILNPGKRVTVVLAADDIEPDPTRPGPEIAEECYELYGPLWVMQPIGDVEHVEGTDRICGSPWLSREWMMRAYGGRFVAPLWYAQFYGDEELQNVAERLGVLHQREDLTQPHLHWCRKGASIKRLRYQIQNSDRYWNTDKETFDKRASLGFPGHELGRRR